MHRQRERAGASLRGPVMALCLMTLGLWGPSQAAEFSCGAGDVACLIEAINTANANGEANTITLEAGTYPLTVVDNTTDGENGLPSITSPFLLTIRGAGAETTVIERQAGAPVFRLVHVAATGTLALKGLTLQRGSGGRGGGIYNEGTLTLTNSTVSGNSAGGGTGVFGGGIVNSGTLTLTNSTVSGNRASGSMFPTRGGGIYNEGTLTLTNSTLTGNTATGRAGADGGGIANLLRGTTALQNTIVALNTADPTAPDCSGAVTSLGYNVIGDPTGCTTALQDSDLTGDPGLGDFTDGDTPGRGHVPLLPDSPAIDAGNDAACPPTDQLGQPRVGRCDIGAIEFQPPDVDVVAIRQAIFVDQLALLFMVATSSAAPDAELFVTVPDCLSVWGPRRPHGDRDLQPRGRGQCLASLIRGGLTSHPHQWRRVRDAYGRRRTRHREGSSCTSAGVACSAAAGRAVPGGGMRGGVCGCR